MGALVQAVQTMETLVCWSRDPVCGVRFAMPSEVADNHRARGTGFWCPNGHKLAFGESVEAALRRKLADAEKREAWAKREAADEMRRRQKIERANTKLKKRISAGVCPCCQRTVSQLARHMATKHPDYSR